MYVTSRPRYVSLFVSIPLLIVLSSRPDGVQAQDGSAPGGFVESTTDLTVRPLLSASEIAGFLPARGPFTFPAPYHTQGVRLTNSSDCAGGDCVMSMGYSYWRRINNHVGSDTLYAVLTLDRSRGGGGPTLFSYNKVTGVTTKVGPLFDGTSGLSWAHGEMFYFSGTRPTAYYIHEGPRLMRYDILARTTEFVVDVSAHYGADKYIWQPSSSDDDRVHAFTLRRDGDWATLGCAVYDETTGAHRFFNGTADFDECQIDKSGRFVVIKEQLDGANGEDNRIVDLATGAERVLLDPDGAGGHSDLGHGYMVAEDNWNQLPGSSRLWWLDQDPSAPGNGRLVFHATDWNWGMNHITHTNARGGLAPEEQIACSSETTRSSIPRGNEVICYKLDGSLKVLVVAPIMTDLNASGGGDDYYKAPKGNLDVTGEFFIWTSNMGGSRLDAFIVRVPTHHLGAARAPGASPSPSPSPSPGPTPGPDPGPGGGGGGASKYIEGDYDGDRRADVTVYRPSTGSWYALESTTRGAVPHGLAWGGNGDIPVTGDFDGDGRDDITVFRPSNGSWSILGSGTGFKNAAVAYWGGSGDVPVAADYDGDGRTDIAVFRPSDGSWSILRSSTGFSQSWLFRWGATGDQPVRGDFDGDGRADVVVFRPSNGVWYLLLSGAGFSGGSQLSWGKSGDVAVSGDFDGDGRADITVFRASDGSWSILRSATGFTSAWLAYWGANGDVPVPSDYDGDGTTDLAVFQPSTGYWSILRSSTGFTSPIMFLWGGGGDIPLPK